MTVLDYVVIGSGCAGSMAAQTLVEAGVHVTMLDVGEQEEGYAKLIPDKNFIAIRKSEAEQYKYFIGKHADEIVWSDVGKGAQITPPRKHMVRNVDTYLPIQSKTFSPVESLGYGGLGIGWGLQCWQYQLQDLRATGLDVKRMPQAYETVSKRIGISGTRDGAAAYTLGSLQHYQPSAHMDRNHQLIYKKYLAHQQSLQKKGLYMGRTPLALITKDLPGRKKYAYKDMDFYADNDRSAWRPWITVNALKKHRNFSYHSGLLAIRFIEQKDGTIEIVCMRTDNNQITHFRCKKLILATGTLSSARIVLRSLGQSTTKLPLLCNPYTYIPCLQPRLVGKAVEQKKLGFAQLSLFLDQQQSHFDVSVASLYSYQSLMMFRTIRQLPLGFANARRVMQYIMSGIVIMGVHHPDTISPHKYVQLTATKQTPTGDTLQAVYDLPEKEQAALSRREQTFTTAMRTMGTYAIKRINPGFGASIHYAGTIPFSVQDKPYTLSPEGRVHGTRNVYIADSSGFNYLPAPGLTFSLLANAHITAENCLKHA